MQWVNNNLFDSFNIFTQSLTFMCDLHEFLDSDQIFNVVYSCIYMVKILYSISTHGFAFNLSIKIYSSMKIHILHIWYCVIYRLFIKQPCINSFIKRYWSWHRKICWAKYALFTWLILSRKLNPKMYVEILYLTKI